MFAAATETSAQTFVDSGFSTEVVATLSPYTLVGIAWAPDRGVSRVEVGVDGVWDDARLSRPISNATWVQWIYDWAATPGDHIVQVRATDGHGETQPEIRTPPAPDGARGWHTIGVTVS